MYSVESLEKKWYKYKKKKLIVPSLFLTLFLAVSVFSVYYKVNSKIVVDDYNATKVSNKKDYNPNSTGKAKIKDLSIQVPSLEKKFHVDAGKVGQIIFETENKKNVKKNNLLIQITDRSSSKNIASDIERRFEFTKDKHDAVFLAKYYYDKEEYAKSEYWALETNKLDSHLEDGWILFAKAQAKQGKRIEALKILQIYFNESKSTQAKSLIDKIRRGKKF